MSKYDGCEIASATLLEFIHFPAVGQVGPKLSNKQDGVNKAVKMTLDGNFVIMEIKDKMSNKIYTELIPVTFFKQLTPVSK